MNPTTADVGSSESTFGALRTIVKSCQQVGIDVPFMVALTAAFLVSISIGGRIISAFRDRYIGRLISRFNEEPHNRGGHVRVTREHITMGIGFESDTTIRRTERIIFIFCYMAGLYVIIAGWLTLRAFFGWVEGSDLNMRSGGLEISRDEGAQKPGGGTADADVMDSPAHRAEVRMLRYYVYLYGIALSLIVAISCAIVGNVIVKMIGYFLNLKSGA